MSDLIINGKTYAGVETVRIPLADGSGNAIFVPEGTGGGELIEETGEWTPEADTTHCVVNTAGKPIIAYLRDNSQTATENTRRAVDVLAINTGIVGYYVKKTNSGGTSIVAGAFTPGETFRADDATDNSVQGVQFVESSVDFRATSSYPFKAGHTYTWKVTSLPLE